MNPTRFPAPRLAAAAALTFFVLGGEAQQLPEPRADAGGSNMSARIIEPLGRREAPPRFTATIRRMGPETIARMGTSWRPGCPVPLGDLRSIAMPHWDFDGAVKQGELIVHRRHARNVAGVFEQLFAIGFPIARMEPANGYMGNDPPLAQFNNTVGFNCRAPVGGGKRWSEHSYGTAVDINPDQNPYVSRRGRIEPPFGAPWVDRTLPEPGMIHRDHLAVRAFRAIGWRWGGFWPGTKDYMTSPPRDADGRLPRAMGDDTSGTFDLAEYAHELNGPPNHDVGTKLLLENDRVKIWEIVLEPGRRAPFHRHAHTYFYVCGAPGRVRTRFDNGYYAEGDEEAGGFAYMEHSEENPGIHDLENVGDTTIRYTTVELL